MCDGEMGSARLEKNLEFPCEFDRLWELTAESPPTPRITLDKGEL